MQQTCIIKVNKYNVCVCTQINITLNIAQLHMVEFTKYNRINVNARLTKYNNEYIVWD